jgi:hypothetical protein
MILKFDVICSKLLILFYILVKIYDGQGTYHEWWESRKEDHWEDKDVGEWSILKWVLERQNGMV